uniref:Uncharacterized protein n=1 Tax=Panagrolaimus sp. PS1159 TaxID=55785 RepID=A0AC35F469_9BILA
METKNDFLFSKNNSQSFVKDNYHFDNDNHYSNVNLNQNYKILIPVQTLSKKYEDSNYGAIDDYVGNEKLQSMNKFSKTSNFSIFNNEFEKIKKQWKKNGSNTSINSTLSFHISAYENTFESVVSNFIGDKSVKSLRKDKQIFADVSTFLIQNPFEYPRQQQNDEMLEPEVSHFKASQHLINPNEASNKIDKQGNDYKMFWVIKIRLLNLIVSKIL